MFKQLPITFLADFRNTSFFEPVKVDNDYARSLYQRAFYDRDYPAQMWQMHAMPDIRGRTAEGMAFDIFFPICMEEVLKPYFPKAYDFHKALQEGRSPFERQ